MTKIAVAAVGLVALLSAPATAVPGTSGPFTGFVRENQTRTHRFDNNPLDQPCPQVITEYTVTLRYTPTTDVLTLSVGSRAVTGSGGQASLSFLANYCTSFDIRVTGTEVDSFAHYTVSVSRGGAGT